MQVYFDLLENENHMFSVVYHSRTGNSYTIRPSFVGEDPDGPLHAVAIFHVREHISGKQANFGRGVNFVQYAGTCGLSSESDEDKQRIRIVVFRAALADLEERLDSFTEPYSSWEEACIEYYGEADLPDYNTYRDKECEYQRQVPGGLACSVPTATDETQGKTNYLYCNACGFPAPPFRCKYLFVETMGMRGGGSLLRRMALVNCGRGQEIEQASHCSLKKCFMPVEVYSRKKHSGLQIPKSVEEAAERHEDNYIELKGTWDDNSRKKIKKDVAAFSSCEGGVIYVGITDDGRTVGIPQPGNSAEMDVLLRTLVSNAHAQVSPKPTVSVDIFPDPDNPTVYPRIIVHPGDAPVYYCNGVPYIRRGSESLPALPEEVYRMVKLYNMRSSPTESAASPMGDMTWM